MIIDDKSFHDLSSELRGASEDLVAAARRLSRLCDPGRAMVQATDAERRELLGTLDSLVAMNRRFTSAERLMHAVWKANRRRPVPPQ